MPQTESILMDLKWEIKRGLKEGMEGERQEKGVLVLIKLKCIIF